MKPGLEVGATGQRELQVGGSDVIYLGESQANGAIVFSTPSMSTPHDGHCCRFWIRTRNPSE